MNPAIHSGRAVCYRSRGTARAPLSCLSVVCAAGCLLTSLAAPATASESIPGRLFVGQQVPLHSSRRLVTKLLYPPAPQPGKEAAVPPPGENQYFPVRSDDQPYFLMIDQTVNLTDILSRFYFNPHSRGEEWVPEDPFSLPERATRLMSTWKEYDQQSFFRVGNPIARWLERASGFGP